MAFLFLDLAAALPLAEIPPYSKNHPYGLITPSHGIVTENDFANDACLRNPEPDNPKKAQIGSLYWQCFPVEPVS
jgi:hypothetical protein